MINMSNLEEMRNKAQQKISEVRSRIQSRTLRRPSVGQGTIITQVMTRADRLTARIQERKPSLLPMVKEFKPGERVKQILTPQTANRPLNRPMNRPLIRQRKDLSVDI